MILGDTIAAVSTARGKGGVALLRVSGDRAVEICERVFLPRNRKPLSNCPARTALYGSILAPDATGAWSEIDDGIATLFRAPASFTGEDTVEIACHGGILLTETVLTALIAAGARAAEAGEFTRRAFLNGKMGLSAAEALGNLLEAQTAEQLTLAHAGTDGRIEARCREIYDSLCAVLAAVYAKIDYPDEDLADMSREEMEAALSACILRVEALRATYRTGHAIAEGIPTVICGKPNVGKSSLYNRILGRDAAIVTDIKGTTRDVLCDTAALGRVTLRLYDTAGLHETADVVEQIGIDRARRAMDRAELILAVVDASREPDAESEALLADLRDRSAECVILLNKSDAGKAASWDGLTAGFSHVLAISLLSNPEESVLLLRETAEAMFTDGSIDLSRDAVVANARQYASLVSAIAALDRAMEAIACGMAADLYCMDAEGALAAFGELDGKEVGEAIVSEIFSKFCVGK
jgi:tRNA modification GTPase